MEGDREVPWLDLGWLITMLSWYGEGWLFVESWRWVEKVEGSWKFSEKACREVEGLKEEVIRVRGSYYTSAIYLDRFGSIAALLWHTASSMSRRAKSLKQRIWLHELIISTTYFPSIISRSASMVLIHLVSMSPSAKLSTVLIVHINATTRSIHPGACMTCSIAPICWPSRVQGLAAVLLVETAGWPELPSFSPEWVFGSMPSSIVFARPTICHGREPSSNLTPFLSTPSYLNSTILPFF